jgi:glycosyltransferase involved in cell wall biosynthesis
MHVITGLAAGGAENQLQLLLRHTRHDAEVVTLTNPGTVADAIRAEGTAVENVAMRGNRDPRALERLRVRMRRARCEIVHVHLYRACVYGRIAARLAGVPRVVTTEHSLGEGYIEGRPTTRANRLLYLATERLSDVTVAVSETVRERLVGWGIEGSRTVVIPNGVDFDALSFDPASRREARHELGIPQNSAVIGALGRLDPVKRFDLLLEAAGPLLGPDRRLLIVGDGPMRAELEAKARHMGASSHVLFVGERSDTARLLAAMDLLAAPSSSETFGLAVIEALGAGLPVVYGQCPALDEVPDRGGAKARHASGGRDDLLEGLRTALAADRSDRTPPRSVLARFDIRTGAAAIDRLYESLG